MINSVVLMGRLTADPELRTTDSGIYVTSFTIAVDRSFAKQGEERQADFINLVAWRHTAEFINKYFGKGSMIAVEGSIQTRRYEDRNGNKRIAFEVLVNSASFCGSKSDNNTAQKPEAAKASEEESYEQQSIPDTPYNRDFETIVDDDDLPF